MAAAEERERKVACDAPASRWEADSRLQRRRGGGWSPHRVWGLCVRARHQDSEGPSRAEGGTGQTTEEGGASQSILSGPWLNYMPRQVRNCCSALSLYHSDTVVKVEEKDRSYCLRTGADFPAGPAVKSPPASAGPTALTPGLGSSHGQRGS